MKRFIERAIVIIWCLLLPALAQSQVPKSSAETLLKVSGAWNQFADITRQVNMGMQQSGALAQLPQEESLRLRRIIDDVYSAQRLRESVQSSVAKHISQDEYVEIMRWYESSPGQLFTGIEESATAAMKDMSVAISDGNEALAASTAERQILISKLVRATRVSEFTVNITIQSALGAFEGVSSVIGMNGLPSSADLRARLEKQRPQMLAFALGTSNALFAATYSPANDAEMGQYIEFLSSKAGAHWTAVMIDAMNRCLSLAAIEFGKRIPKEKARRSL